MMKTEDFTIYDKIAYLEEYLKGGRWMTSGTFTLKSVKVNDILHSMKNHLEYHDKILPIIEDKYSPNDAPFIKHIEEIKHMIDIINKAFIIVQENKKYIMDGILNTMIKPIDIKWGGTKDASNKE